MNFTRGVQPVNMLNIGDLLDAIAAGFPDEIYGYEESTKIATIGKPNREIFPGKCTH